MNFFNVSNPVCLREREREREREKRENIAILNLNE